MQIHSSQSWSIVWALASLIRAVHSDNVPDSSLADLGISMEDQVPVGVPDGLSADIDTLFASDR